MQAARLFGTQGGADDAGCIANDERHFFGRAVARGDEQIAFILTLVIVSDDDNLAFGEGLDRGFNTVMAVRHDSTSKRASPAGLERPSPPLADLTPMHQIVVGQHACHHGLTNRHRSNTDARIVTALGRNIGVVAKTIHGFSRSQNRRRRLDREPGDNGLPRRNSAEDAARVIGQENRLAIISHPHLVGVLDPAHCRRGKTVTNLHAFYRIYAHQGGSDGAIELGIDRRTESGRNAVSDNLDNCAAGRTSLPYAIEITFEKLGLLRIRTEEWVLLDRVPVPTRPIDLVRPHLHKGAAHRQAGHNLARNGPGSNPRRSFPRRRPSATPIAMNAVFDAVRIAAMAPPAFVLALGVALCALVY